MEDIIKELENAKSKGWNDFNVIEIIMNDKIWLETKHTRMICALLDPHGEHGQGTLFLKLFIETVLPDIKLVHHKP